MRKLIAIAAFISLLVLAGCAQERASAPAPVSAGSPSHSAASAGGSSNTASDSVQILVDVNGAQFAMAPADTEAARALVEQLANGPVKVSLHAYGGFEQVGPLPWILPASDEQITTSPGDVMLYQGNQITIFTGSNSWAYTPLGHLEGATSESLLEAFGAGDAEISLELKR